MRSPIAWWASGLAVLLLIAFESRADQITLVSGEILSGKIQGREDNAVRFDPVSGDVRSVSLGDIQSIKLGESRPKGPLKVRYVRIDLPGAEKYLHLRELQVFVGDENVALSATPRQSTTFEFQGTLYPPKLAIDGLMETLNHTGDSHPWFEIDLGKEVGPTRVVVHNRIDQNLQSRLNGFRVLLFNENWELQWARKTPNAGDTIEFTIPQSGELIEPEALAEIENYVGRPGPIDAPLLKEPREFIWVEDAVPSGANHWDSIKFDEQQTVYSGSRSFKKEGEGNTQSGIVEVTNQLRVGEGDKFFAMVYLDPAKPPRCVMLQFHDGVNWEHRAYWGEDVITWGSGENPAHHRMGDLPPTGQWVRLEVDAAAVGCPPGTRLDGWSCTQHGGVAYWDHLGIVTRTPQDEPRPRFVAGDDFEWKLRDGSLFSGTVRSWSGADAVIETHLSTIGELTIPTTSLSEAWSQGVITGETKIERQPVDPKFDQVYVKTDTGVTVIAGEITELAREGAKINYEGQERKISRAKILGVVFRSSGPLPSKEFALRVKTVGDRMFVGQLTNWDRHAVTLTTLAGEISIPRRSIVDVQVNNGRILDLTELTPSDMEETPYFDRHWKYQVNKSLTGKPLQIGQTTLARGLSMHSRSVLTYDVPNSLNRFRAKLGLQHLEGDRGNVTVRIWGDDKVLFEKEAITSATPLENVSVDLTNCRQLRLEVDFGENFDVGDHVVWGDPVMARD